MARKPRMKPKPQGYLRLQSSAMAKSVMEPAIERYLKQLGVPWDTSTHISGLRTYFVPVGPETDWKAIVQGFTEPLFSDAPSLTHLFWSYDPGMGQSWQCGTTQQRVRRGQALATNSGTADNNTTGGDSTGPARTRNRVRRSADSSEQQDGQRKVDNATPVRNRTSSAGASTPRARRRIKQ